MELKYHVTFTSLVMDASTTVWVDGHTVSGDDREDAAIDLAAERIDEELGVAFTDTCHSVHVELLEVSSV